MSVWMEEHNRQREHSVEVQSKRLGGVWPNCNREARYSDKWLSEEGGDGTDWQLGGSWSSCREQHSGFCGLGKSSSRDVMWKGQAVCGSFSKVRAGGSIPNIHSRYGAHSVGDPEKMSHPGLSFSFFKPITLLTSPHLANSHTMFETGSSTYSCLGSLLTSNRSLSSYPHPDI